MKTTGIVRKVDELGRIVLPIELRRTLDIEERDSLERCFCQVKCTQQTGFGNVCIFDFWRRFTDTFV